MDSSTAAGQIKRVVGLGFRGLGFRVCLGLGVWGLGCRAEGFVVEGSLSSPTYPYMIPNK